MRPIGSAPENSSGRAGSKTKASWLTAGAVAGLALITCVSSPSRVGVDVSGLERVESWEVDEAYVRVGLEPDRYKRFWIEPVRVAMDRDPRIPRIAERERQRMANYFETRIRMALDDRYPLVEEPAADVVRVRAKITGLAYNRPPLDYDRPGGLQPGPRSRTSQNPKVIFSRVHGVGDVWIEVEFVDSQTGEALLVVADRQRGWPLQHNANRSTTWGDAEQAFRRWARLLRYHLDDLHGRDGDAITAPEGSQSSQSCSAIVSDRVVGVHRLGRGMPTPSATLPVSL